LASLVVVLVVAGQSRLVGAEEVDSCNVGVAHASSSDWPRALRHLEDCSESGRADTAALVALRKTKKALRVGDYAPVSIVVEPKGARVSVSSWEDADDFSAPRELWLPFGNYQLTATAKGYHTTKAKLVIDSNARYPIIVTMQRIADVKPGTTNVDFGETDASGGAATHVSAMDPKPKEFESLLPERYARAPDPDVVAEGDRGRGPWPYLALSVGAASLAAGVVFTVVAADTNDDAKALPPGVERDALRDDFRNERTTAIGFYAVGAIATGVGLYLLLRHTGDDGVVVAGVPQKSGGSVFVRVRF